MAYPADPIELRGCADWYVRDAALEELIERVRVRSQIAPLERRRIREQAHISLRELASALGVSHRTVLNWEEGKHSPNSDAEDRYYQALVRLREALNGT